MPIDLKNNLSLTASGEVAELCDRFLKKYNLTHFLYGRLYEDSSRFTLSNRADWGEHYFLQDYYNIARLDRHPSCYPTCFVIWDNWDKFCPDLKTITQDQIENFNIAHGLTLTIRGKNYVDVFDFATSKENYNINNFYLANIDIFENFSLYFLEQAKTLIQAANADRFYVRYADNIDIYTEYPDALLQAGSLKILDRYKKPLLSSRELNCIEWLLKGKTAAEMALILDISSRTVEKHLINIKEKLNCNTMFQLGMKITELGLNKLALETDYIFS